MGRFLEWFWTIVVTPGAPLQSQNQPASGAAPADLLLSATEDVVLEMHPHRRQTLRVTLDSSFERDLGLDSLGRAELISRLEHALKLELPENLLAEAERLSDVLAAMERVMGAVPRGPSAPQLPVRGPAEVPLAARTLVEVLEFHAAADPKRPHILLDEGEAGGRVITYGELRQRAGRVAAGLAASGVGPGSAVAIMLPTDADFFAAFFGVLYAGGTAVPIYPPARPSHLEDHIRQQARILANAGARMLIAPSEARRVGQWLRAGGAGLDQVATVAELERRQGAAMLQLNPAPGELALLQYTSGSTGDPKGVMLTHANLLANIRAMCQAIGVKPDDVFVSWLPLYHDMGLIGAWLGSLYHGVPVAIMSPLRFLARPANWLRAIHRHRGTLTAAPNFAFDLCLNKITDEEIEGVDLSSLRMAANGAEPVSPATLRRFIARFAGHGFKATAMAPVYGLAECSVGVAFPPLGREPLIDRIDREALEEEGEARPAPAPREGTVEFVACGQALPGHEVRVVDASGRETPERRQGRLQFRGPSATSGYFRNPEKTAELFDGEWLETGDLAYMVGGDIFITGRSKDIIIRAGRNIYPQEIESRVSEIEGIRKGCVAVFGAHDPASGTERLVVLAETRETAPEARVALQARVDEAVTLILGGPADEVVLAPPNTVLKTSSGKIKRSASRALYEQGQIGKGRRALWLQIARLTAQGLKPRLADARRAAREAAYAAWWWGMVGLLFIPLWLAILMPPTAAGRWRAVGWVARLMLRLTATPIKVTGLENLPAGGGVLAVNHASYIDGLSIMAALPRPGRFIAKAEFGRQFFARNLLGRLGAIFVERTDAARGVEDAGKAVAAARAGELTIFFPEGTFQRRPGLLPFRLGAFQAAAEAGVPVTPAVLTGTRQILRGGGWFPRPGSIALNIGKPVEPKGQDWPSVLALRDAVRAAMLAAAGEPDLASEWVRFEAPPT